MIAIRNKNNQTPIAGKHKTIYATVALFILLFVAYFQLFYKLDKLPLRIWDEGKNAVSAYEMNTNGNYLVRYYEEQPDDWGFKPPFLTWNQVISMKVFGINEFAIRFPSALYALFTVILIFYFLYHEFKNPFIGLFAALVLLTSFGYLDHHVVRTGDHDSILVFFLTAQLIFFYKYANSNKNIYLILFTLALILASFTKGVAGLFFLPGITVYLVFSSKLKNVLSNRNVYLCILAFLISVGGYYSLREIADPGYLKAVWENELVPRYTNTASNYTYEHTSDYLFYLRNLWNKRFAPWIYVLPLALVLLLSSKNAKVKSLFLYILIVGISFLVIISGGSKGTWYDAPLFPVLAILLALSFFQLYSSTKNITHKRNIAIITTLLIFAPLLFISGQKTKRLTFEIEEKSWNHETQGINYYLRDNSEELSALRELGIAYNGYHSHIRFYANIASDNGTKTNFVNYRKIDAPSVVIASQKEIQEFIEENYIFTKNKKDFGTYIYNIEAKKPNE